MPTRKFAGRAALVLGIVVSPFMLVLAADNDGSRASSAAGLTNSVVVESQILTVGIPGSTIGVSVSNDIPIAGLVVPMEIRPLTPGASIAQTITYRMNPTGRVANSPLGFADDVDSLWPESQRVVRRSCIACTNPCTGSSSRAYCDDDVSCSYPTEPYGLFFGAVSTGDPRAGELVDLEPGTDPGPSADASLQIILNQVGGIPGFFEIDTSCWTPGNRLAFAGSTGAIIVPSFTKGVIELRCVCPCPNDPVCDGLTDVRDVVTTVDIAFRGGTPLSHPYCPRLPADNNCDGAVSIVDVVNVIEVAFRSGDPALHFCDPCAL